MSLAGAVDDPRALRRPQLTLALQAAASVALGVLLVAVVTYLVAVSRLDADISARLEDAARSGDVTSPPPGIWVVQVGADGVRRASRDAPDGYPTAAQIAASGDGPSVEEVHLGPQQEYLIWTGREDGRTAQAGIDFRRREDERHRLLFGLAVAGAIATLAAAASGMLIARRAMAPLHQAVARQRRFVADASHELRTPLARLALRAELLQRELRAGADPAQLDEDGEAIVAQARHLSEIMDDLLLSAQLGGDRRAGDLVDLGRLATRVVDADRQRAAQRSITLTARAVPAPPVRGVAPALTRAVSALVDNALRHAPVGGQVEVEVAPDDEGNADGVLFAVADDGPGLDDETAAQVFGRFTTGTGGRHGLGLSLVREVVHAHGGTIEVDRDRAVGARFVVRLPAARPDRS